MNDEYISIAEFAKRAGVSVQAIYKRLSTDLSTEFKLVENKKMLKTKALEKFGLNQVENQVEKVENQVETINLLKKTIDLLEKELSLKNKEIEELHNRLRESHAMVQHQQELHAGTIQQQISDGAIPEKKKKWFWQK